MERHPGRAATQQARLVSHPTTRLDPAIHQPVRLGILTAVCETKRVDFVSLRNLLDLTDGNLSRHLSTLEKAGYIKQTNVFEDRKPARGSPPQPLAARRLLRRSQHSERSSVPPTGRWRPPVRRASR